MPICAASQQATPSHIESTRFLLASRAQHIGCVSPYSSFAKQYKEDVLIASGERPLPGAAFRAYNARHHLDPGFWEKLIQQ